VSQKELLRVEHLKKYFQTPRGTLSAVEDVSFRIEERQTLGVVGESGCGKSTLGRCILRLHEPTGGKVIFNGENILEYDKVRLKRLRSDMQIIFQDPYASLNPRMTVSQAIAAPLLIQGVYTVKEKDKIQKKVLEMMDVVGLARRLINSYPHELDGGRRQRIGIARALALNPKFIVCDEPVSALDVSIQAQVLNLMQDLQQQMGLTYLFITHNLAVVKHLSDQIVVMYLGQLVEQAPPEELFRNPKHPYTKVFRGFSSCYPDLNRRPHPYQLIGRVRFFAFGRFCVFFRSTDRTIWHSCVRCLRPLVSPCGSACGSAKMVPLKISTTISKAQYFTHRRFLSVFNCSRRGAGTLGSNF